MDLVDAISGSLRKDQKWRLAFYESSYEFIDNAGDLAEGTGVLFQESGSLVI